MSKAKDLIEQAANGADPAQVVGEATEAKSTEIKFKIEASVGVPPGLKANKAGLKKALEYFLDNAHDTFGEILWRGLEDNIKGFDSDNPDHTDNAWFSTNVK